MHSANRANEQRYIDRPTEESVICLKEGWLEKEFDVLRENDNESVLTADDLRLFNSLPIVFFSEDILSGSSENKLKILVMLTLLMNGDLSVGFVHEIITHAVECIAKKQNQGKLHLRLLPGDFFGFAENQKKATFGLGYKIIIERNIEKALLFEKLIQLKEKLT